VGGADARDGNLGARDVLIPLVYDELRRVVVPRPASMWSPILISQLPFRREKLGSSA
jgi:hypothetical protein